MKWRDAKKFLPAVGQAVWVYTPKCSTNCGHYDVAVFHGRNVKHPWVTPFNNAGDVGHWMPLPEPPESK